MTAPANGVLVSGTVNLSAQASDNVGVVSVQFLRDGAVLGAPDAAAPYGVSWDSTTVANGSHTLAARAVDAAGNATTSAAVTSHRQQCERAATGHHSSGAHVHGERTGRQRDVHDRR